MPRTTQGASLQRDLLAPADYETNETNGRKADLSGTEARRIMARPWDHLGEEASSENSQSQCLQRNEGSPEYE